MRVLILGGTSFFGRDIAEAFHRAGHSISIFTRGNQLPSDLPPHHHIRGDRKSREDLAKAWASQSFDLVIDNLAYDARDIEIALETFKGCPQYLMTSSVSIYRFIPKEKYYPPIKESDANFDLTLSKAPEKLNPANWNYAHGKLEAEKILIKNKDIPWTIFRPPVVYGPNDVTSRGFWYLARLLEGGPILLSNYGSSSFQICYSKDLAKLYLLAAESRNSKNKIYNTPQKEVITLRSFIEESAAALGVSPKLINVCSEFISDFGGPYSSFENLIYDDSAVSADLGFIPTPWKQFAKETALWFTKNSNGKTESLLNNRREELQFAEKWMTALSAFKTNLS